LHFECVIFSAEKEAVNAFAHAITIPFEDLTGSVESSSEDKSPEVLTQTRAAAKRRWAFLVGRGVLLNAAKDLSFRSIDRAYGGRGIVADKKLREEERALRKQQAEIDPLEDDDPVSQPELIVASAETGSEQEEAPSNPSTGSATRQATVETTEGETEDEDSEDDDEEDSDGDIESDEGEDEDEDEDNTEEEDEHGLSRTRSGRMFWRSDYSRTRYRRHTAELDVLCAPHSRVYTGHCNVKTVKDVNYFGLQDEYVVSGSDSGHVFIWDRKTAQLVNILEGDGEVRSRYTNCIQDTH
jgi:nuclear receptor interaction protein